MPRRVRIQFPGAIYHIVCRGNRGQEIFYSDVDRQDFLRTLGEACGKTAFEVHAYCLLATQLHLVLATPKANLVPGMQWMLSSYTLRANRRHALSGHLFAGRYKSVLVDGGTEGFLKSVCDYVHLRPARTGLLSPEERLTAFPWSSLPWCLAAPEHRPPWLRTEPLLREYDIPQDTAAGRAEFERRVEALRKGDSEGAAAEHLRSDWGLGSEAFRAGVLKRMDGKLREHHPAALKYQSAEAHAEEIIADELRRLRWSNADLALRLKGDPLKLQIANRLRKETVLPMTWISERLHLGTAKSARPRLRHWQSHQKAASAEEPRPSPAENAEFDVALL